MREMKDSGIEWIGKIPEHWEIIKTKRVFQNNKQVAGKQAGDYERLALTMNGVIKRNKDDAEGLQPESFDGYQVLEQNQLVFKLIDLENVKTSRVGLSPYTGIVSPAYIVLKNTQADNRFFYYYYMNMYYQEIFNYMGGEGVRSALNAKDLLEVPLPNISIPEQQAIADYLDGECARIDGIVEKQRQIIEKLKEYKKSVITEVVTRGLNPDVPMKDSGIEWIGKIPQHWEIKKIKYLFQLRDERNYLPLEQVNLISLYTDKGVLQHADIEETTGNKAQNADGYKLVYEGDIIVNIILCWMGAIGFSAYNGVTSPAYDIYKPLPKTNSKYYHYLFRTSLFSGECYKVGRGIMLMRWRTYSDQFKSIYVSVPPIEEQQEIADYLDGECARIDTIIEKRERMIELMTEYKKSLIYECVTGKKEIVDVVE